jgi:NADH-quinone oxidoreductase subunit H
MSLLSPELAAVGVYEPWWIQILKALVLFFVALQILPAVIITERKLLGRFQMRYGPNRVGPYGTMQPLAEILKFAAKQDFRPKSAIPHLYYAAPALSIIAAVSAFAIIPFGDTVDIFGTEVGLYGVDLSIGVLYVFAFGAIAFYGLMLGGWASGSKYSFLGSMRAAAQLISYEVAQGLSLLGVLMMAGTLSLTEIVAAQEGLWYVVPQLVGFIVFMVAGFAETNRAPFDMPEADAELVQGYMTEYGGTKMVAFLFAEYLNMLIVSLLAVTFFMGGWMLPFGLDAPGWVDPLVVLAKMFVFLFFFMWVRATLPRLRYDQLMSLGWKVMLPVATLNAMVTAVIVVVSDN